MWCFYGQLPTEDQSDDEKHLCSKLVKATHGTGDAAQNWQTKRAEKMKELGFTFGKVSRCHVYQVERDVCGLHGDDCVLVRYEHELKKLMAAKFKLKVATTSSQHQEPLRVLNRSILWMTGGGVYESDHLHAARLLEKLELGTKQRVSSA